MDIFGRLLPLDPSSHHHACAPLRKQCLSNFASFSLSFLTTLIGLQLPPNLKFLLLYLLSLSTPLFPRLLSLYIFNFTPRLSKQPVSPQLLYLPFLPRLLLLFSHFLLCLQSPCHLYLLHRRSIHPKCPETPAILSSIILDSKNPPPQVLVIAPSSLTTDLMWRIGLQYLLKYSMPDAFYNSNPHYPPPKCYLGTRMGNIALFITGALGDSDQEEPILRKLGLFGVGKSAVARSCAEALAPTKNSLPPSSFPARMQTATILNACLR